MPAPTPLADFDPALARAVVTVLRREGIPATIVGDEVSAMAEVTVLVPDELREAALATMWRSMEAITAEQRRTTPVSTAWTQPEAAFEDPHESEEDDGPPLLFERLRSLGFVPVLLIPVLVVTLAQVRLPAAYVVAIIIGGMAALVAWRDGRRDRGDEGGDGQEPFRS